MYKTTNTLNLLLKFVSLSYSETDKNLCSLVDRYRESESTIEMDKYTINEITKTFKLITQIVITNKQKTLPDITQIRCKAHNQPFLKKATLALPLYHVQY